MFGLFAQVLVSCQIWLAMVCGTTPLAHPAFGLLSNEPENAPPERFLSVLQKG